MPTVKRHKNTIKQINTKKLINNFSEKYSNNSTSKNNNTIKELISENLAIIILGVIAFSFLVVGIYFYFRQGNNIKEVKLIMAMNF